MTKTANILGMKRVQKNTRGNDLLKGNHISNGAIRRLARRAGIKLISKSLYDGVKSHAWNFMLPVAHKATVFAEHARRKTVNLTDIKAALKEVGSTIYG